MSKCKIAFIDDVLRHQLWPPKDFFYDLLRFPITEATGAAPDVSVRHKIWNNPETAHLLTPPDVDAALPDDNNRWLESFEKLVPSAEKIYEPYLIPGTLYFSYEMTPGLKRFLKERGYTYIDFRISPIRFLPDLLVAVETNVPNLMQALAGIATQHREVREIAGRLRAAAVHNERCRPIRPRKFKDYAFFIGQTPYDATVVKDGAYVRIEQFRKEITKATGGAPLLYLPHPSAPQEHAFYELDILRSIDKSCEILTRNLYDVMCYEEDASFIGLSSGALQEAPFFGKKATAFLPQICPVRFPDDPESKGYLQLPLDVFLSEDFIHLALGDSSRIPKRQNLLQIRPHQLRELHNVWWGFSDHIINEKKFWLTVRGPFQQQIEHNTRFLLNSFADKTASASAFQKELSQYVWHWTDGSDIEFKADGTVWRDGVKVTIYEVISSARREIMVIWGGGVFLDRFTVADNWDRMKAVNNYGRCFEIKRKFG